MELNEKENGVEESPGLRKRERESERRTNRGL